MTDANQMNISSLAYIGDAVYSLLARSRLLAEYDLPADTLHTRTSAIVNATAQARAAAIILTVLSSQEAAIFTRGRNSHNTHTPKNKSSAEYHTATGLEALFGWLYIKNDTARIDELFGIIYADFGETTADER